MKMIKRAELNQTSAVLTIILKNNLQKIKHFHFQLLMDNLKLVILWEIH